MSNPKTTYTFRSLCEEFKVEIPALQRDYAQGRAEAESVRKKFVAYLAENLKKKRPIYLDFIYGNVRENEENQEIKRFIPLDGQQRLTTLWLLHWWLALRANKIVEAKSVLGNFSYAARFHVQDFCKHLCEENISEAARANKKYADYLGNQAGFKDSWRKDPSIVGMMTMLDAFAEEKALQEVDFSDLWEKELISFSFLNIGAYGLTNDLYIKMNARGKELTKFEQFKSSFYKIIQGHAKVNEFKNKIETDWVDYLWGYRTEDDHTIDTPFLNLLRFVNITAYYAKGGKHEYQPDDILYDLTFIEELYQDEEALNWLIFTLNNLPFLKEIKYENLYLKESFQEAIEYIIQKSGWYHNDLIMIYAALQYKHTHPDTAPDDTHLLEFLRVVRNLVANSTNRLRYWHNMLASIRTLASERDPYMVLSKDSEIKLQGFYSEQLEEEQFKARLFAHNPSVKKQVQAMEDHEVLEGNLLNLILSTCDGKDVAYSRREDEESPLAKGQEKHLDTEKMQQIYEAYCYIYEKGKEGKDMDFKNILGDLLLFSIYESSVYYLWQYRYLVKKDTDKTETYQKHISVFCLARKYAEHAKNFTPESLEKFLIAYEKKEVKRIYKKCNRDFSKVSDRRKQLFLLYVLTIRIENKPISDFFAKGINFAMLPTEKKNYKTLFVPEAGKNPLVFQSYDKNCQYSQGIKREAMTWPERKMSESKNKENTRRELFDKLKEWAKIN